MNAPRLPFGMENSAPGKVEGDDAQTALMRELNFFPTPPWAARAGGELVATLDPLARTVWEPACGEGHMAGPLSERFAVVASDIHAHGYGAVHDFLSGDGAWADLASPSGAIDWVITNPPFAKAEAFAHQGLKAARRGVALLCRLAFEESVGRYPLMRRLAAKATFCERVPMQLGSWDPDLSSATAYAWFVWMHPEAVAESPMGAAIEACWAVEGSLSRLIAPGTCARLTRSDDRRVYAGEIGPVQEALL